LVKHVPPDAPIRPQDSVLGLSARYYFDVVKPCLTFVRALDAAQTGIMKVPARLPPP